jgi:hypothetical protein
MRYPIILTLFFLSHINLTAQDSLRLTFKMNGFKDKDELRVNLIDGVYNLPTDKNELTIFRKLDSPTQLSIMYKSRIKSFWLDNSDIEIYIPKSGFPKEITIEGSKSEDLWNSLLAASQTEKAQIIRDNMDSKVVQHFLASRSYTLLPEDKESLLAQTSDSIQKFAKYNSFSVDVDRGTRLKEGDRMMDFSGFHHR